MNRFLISAGVLGVLIALPVYRDDWLGGDFAGNAFVCEPVHNLVHREIVKSQGRHL